MKNKLVSAYHAFESKIEEFADWAASFSAHPMFLVTHVIWFIAWILFEIEEFPFGLLTMIVSLEAIILSSLILSSTNREAARDRQTLIRSANHAKETHDMLDDIHDDIQEIKEILEDEESALDQIIDDNYYYKRKSGYYDSMRDFD